MSLLGSTHTYMDFWLRKVEQAEFKWAHCLIENGCRILILNTVKPHFRVVEEEEKTKEENKGRKRERKEAKGREKASRFKTELTVGAGKQPGGWCAYLGSTGERIQSLASMRKHSVATYNTLLGRQRGRTFPQPSYSSWWAPLVPSERIYPKKQGRELEKIEDITGCLYSFMYIAVINISQIFFN